MKKEAIRAVVHGDIMARKKTLSEMYLGPEPIWDDQPDESLRRSAVISAFNWYNYFYNHKDAKGMLIAYLNKDNRKKDSAIIKKVPDTKIKTTYSWLMRMSMNGFELTNDEVNVIELEIFRLKGYVKTKEEQDLIRSKELELEDDGLEKQHTKPTIQDRMKEKADNVGGEFEGFLDEFIHSGMTSKSFDDCKHLPINLLKTENISPQHANILLDVWNQHKSEYDNILNELDKRKGRDTELINAYGFNKTHIKNLIKFCDYIINSIGSYITYKKATRSKPKRKVISVETMVSKLKYMKEYEFGTIKLKSIKPVKIPGSKELFVYDTKTRKLRYYVEDPHAGGMSVKNNNIIGFDESKSSCKTLRSPEEQVHEFKSASRPNSRKLFNGLTTIGTKVSGRFNEHLVILRVH
jgi:hypothetical protein